MANANEINKGPEAGKLQEPWAILEGEARSERNRVEKLMKEPLPKKKPKTGDIVKNYPSKPAKRLHLSDLSPELASLKIKDFLEKSYLIGRKTVEILTGEKSSLRQQMEMEKTIGDMNLLGQDLFVSPYEDTGLNEEVDQVKKEKRMDLAAKKQLDDILEKTLEDLKEQTNWIQHYRWNRVSKNRSTGMLVYLSADAIQKPEDQEFPKAA